MPIINSQIGYPHLCLALFALGLSCGGDLRRGSACFSWADSVCSFRSACGLSRAGVTESKGQCVSFERERCRNNFDNDTDGQGDEIIDCLDMLRSQAGPEYNDCPAAAETLLTSGACGEVGWAQPGYSQPYISTPTYTSSAASSSSATSKPSSSATSKPTSSALPKPATTSSSAPVTSSSATSTPSAATCTSASPVSRSAVTRNEDGTGEVTQSNVCVPQLGTITGITLRYNMSSFFGEVTRQAVFSYTANFSIVTGTWFVQVFSTSGQEVMVSGKPVFVGWEEGVWPKPGQGFGSDTTGSPSWSQVFGFYSGGTTFDGYVDETNAKSIYKNGFTLDRLRVTEVNSKAVKY